MVQANDFLYFDKNCQSVLATTFKRSKDLENVDSKSYQPFVQLLILITTSKMKALDVRLHMSSILKMLGWDYQVEHVGR